MNLRPLPPQGSALPAAPHPETLSSLDDLNIIAHKNRFVNTYFEKNKNFFVEILLFWDMVFVNYHNTFILMVTINKMIDSKRELCVSGFTKQCENDIINKND